MESSNDKKSLEQLKKALADTDNPQMKRGLEKRISDLENNKKIKK